MKDPFDWLLLFFAAFVFWMFVITSPKAEEVKKMEDITYCWASHYNRYLPCMYSEKVVEA